MDHYDVIIIGAGMAGLSAAYALAPTAKVLVVEREEAPGYHSTGRSAAVYGSSYGSEKPLVNALTKASGDFFLHPPAGFSEHPLYRDRGVMFVCHESKVEEMQAFYKQMKLINPQMRRMDSDEIAALVPVLKPEYRQMAVYDEHVYELDVHAMQEGYIRTLQHCGGTLMTGFEVEQLSYDQQKWTVSSGERSYCAPVVVNASGAWVDQVAAMAGVDPIGIEPLRRTAILVEKPQGADTESWPLVVEFQEQFYFKPEAGKVLISSANEDPSPPCDVQPDELDIAFAVHNISEATTLEIQRVDHSWAGLRSFVADRNPVIGFDEDNPGFFWLTGQGGVGIQTAPAAGRLAASLILDDVISGELESFNLDKRLFSRARLNDIGGLNA